VNNDQFNTGERGAVRSNSGPSVDHSDPVLREPTTPPTAERNSEACPPNVLAVDVGVGLDVGFAFGFGVEGAQSQHKSGRESEGGALSDTREAGVVLRSEGTQRGWSSSLDELQINRNKYTRPINHLLGRKSYCGVWTVIGSAENGTQKAIRVNCKTWGCSLCGPRKARLYKFHIRRLAESEQLCRFLTLTLDPARVKGEPVRYLRRVFNKFRFYLRRKFGSAIKYIAVLEFQQNGTPHLHVLVDRFVEWQWIRESWSALGGGTVVDIRFVDVHKISRYLSKYLTKELLLSAAGRSRRVTTARSLRLIEKAPRHEKWTLLRADIWSVLAQFSTQATDFKFDNDGFLEGFSIVPLMA